MKITVKRNGSLIIDGQNRTAIYVAKDSALLPSEIVEGLSAYQLKDTVFKNFYIVGKDTQSDVDKAMKDL
jgi:hypothetical protein